MQTKDVRYAVVGLGHIAKGAVLPAFARAERSKLTAIVSGDAAKLKELGDRYGVQHRATYAEYEKLLESGAIDAVYIALPNDQHKDYAIRAAQAGIHVLCEKPLALSVKDCRAMIDAAKAGGVRLMTAYRLHFEAANTRAIEIARSGVLGEPRFFDSSFSFQVREPNLRLEGRRGGGTLWDIGIYCINAARHVFGAEPLEVYAARFNNGEKRFREVDEMTSVVMRFPGERAASFTTSFGATSSNFWRVTGTRGTIHVEPAYLYRGELAFTLDIEGKTEQQRFGPSDQFAPELTHFSKAILEGRDPEPDGWEGLCDVDAIEAALRSADHGRAGSPSARQADLLRR